VVVGVGAFDAMGEGTGSPSTVYAGRFPGPSGFREMVSMHGWAIAGAVAGKVSKDHVAVFVSLSALFEARKDSSGPPGRSSEWQTASCRWLRRRKLDNVVSCSGAKSTSVRSIPENPTPVLHFHSGSAQGNEADGHHPRRRAWIWGAIRM